MENPSQQKSAPRTPRGTPSSSLAHPGNAKLQLGPSGNAEIQLGPLPGKWHSRGYLPHYDRIGQLQSITFRLADSLPQSKLKELEEIIEALPSEADPDLAKRQQIEAWLDAGMGCCALRHPQVAEKVESALLHFDNDRYQLIAWCVMPNHVHVLIEPKIELSKILQSWKSYTGRWAKEQNAELELGVPENHPFWMREYWDRYIRNESHLRNVIEYIHQNPVKAKLCTRAEQWPHSSARERQAPAWPTPGTPSSSLASLGTPSSSSAPPGDAESQPGPNKTKP